MVLADSQPTVGICFGGSDAENLTAVALRHVALWTHPVRVKAVMGPRFRHSIAELERGLDKGQAVVDLISGSEDVWSHLAGCRALLLGGGLMALEAASLGIPTVHLARNEPQRRLLQPLEAADAAWVSSDVGVPGVLPAIELLQGLLQSESLCWQMRRACQSLQLSQGAERTLQKIMSFFEQKRPIFSALG
ncbi:MAG: hypothetical protein ACO3JL_12290, partial [Myxococcota bacterium]